MSYAEDRLTARLLEVDTLCNASLIAATDLEYKERHSQASKHFETYRKTLMPWISVQGAETGNMLDLIAKWYAVYAPDAPVEGDDG